MVFLEIITPDKILFSAEVLLVRVPGAKSPFAMLRNHAPIISTLEPGYIKVDTGDHDTYFELYETAVVENHGNRVRILAENIRECPPPAIFL